MNLKPIMENRAAHQERGFLTKSILKLYGSEGHADGVGVKIIPSLSEGFYTSKSYSEGESLAYEAGF